MSFLGKGLVMCTEAQTVSFSELRETEPGDPIVASFHLEVHDPSRMCPEAPSFSRHKEPEDPDNTVEDDGMEVTKHAIGQLMLLH